MWIVIIIQRGKKAEDVRKQVGSWFWVGFEWGTLQFSGEIWEHCLKVNKVGLQQLGSEKSPGVYQERKLLCSLCSGRKVPGGCIQQFQLHMKLHQTRDLYHCCVTGSVLFSADSPKEVWQSHFHIHHVKYCQQWITAYVRKVKKFPFRNEVVCWLECTFACSCVW